MCDSACPEVEHFWCGSASNENLFNVYSIVVGESSKAFKTIMALVWLAALSEGIIVIALVICEVIHFLGNAFWRRKLTIRKELELCSNNYARIRVFLCFPYYLL